MPDLHKATLYHHKLSKHTERSTEFSCSECDKKFKLKCHLDHHVKSTHLLEPIACEVCGNVFDNLVKLKRHIRNVHSGIVKQKKNPQNVDRSDWTCPICSKVVRAYLKATHLRTHEEPKYTCDICGKKIKTKNNFDQHMNIHMNVLNHRCEPCNKVFCALLLVMKIDSGISVKGRTSTTPQAIGRSSKRKLELFSLKSCTATDLIMQQL